MKCLIILLLLLSFTTLVYSEVSWERQNSNSKANLLRVQFTDNNNGWIAGDSGTILHTSNGGEDWEKQNSGNLYYLDDLCFISSSIGWVVGDSGTILKTTNSGTIWNNQNLPTKKQIMGVSFINENTGWAVGENGIIIKTTNGGVNWAMLDTGISVTNHLWGVQFINDSIGWAVGETGRIIKTTDGGISWIKQSCSTQYRLLKVGFNDENNGIISGFGCVFYTSDGGNNWILKNGSHLIFSDIVLFDSINYWGVSYDGFIIRTYDAGYSWEYTKFNFNPNFSGISCLDTNTAWIVGERGEILHSVKNDVNEVKENGNIGSIKDELIICPNPVESEIAIKVSHIEDNRVVLSIYNSLGQSLYCIFDDFLKSGEYSFQFSFSNDLSSGIYFISLKSGSRIIHKKFIKM